MRSTEDSAQLQTYKRLLELIGKYRLNRSHPACRAAAEFLLGQQTDEGDIRGIYGS